MKIERAIDQEAFDHDPFRPASTTIAFDHNVFDRISNQSRDREGALEAPRMSPRGLGSRLAWCFVSTLPNGRG